MENTVNKSSFKSYEVIHKTNLFIYNKYQQALKDRDVLTLRKLWKENRLIPHVGLDEFTAANSAQKLNYLDLKAILGYTSNINEDIDDILGNQKDTNKSAHIFKTKKDKKYFYYSKRLDKYFNAKQILCKLTGFKTYPTLMNFLQMVTNLPFVSAYNGLYMQVVADSQRQYEELVKPDKYKEDKDFLALSKRFNAILDAHNLKPLADMVFKQAYLFSQDTRLTKDSDRYCFFSSAAQLFERTKDYSVTKDLIGYKTSRQLTDKLNYLVVLGVFNKVADEDLLKKVINKQTSYYNHSTCIEIVQDMYTQVEKSLKQLDSKNFSLTALVKGYNNGNVQRENLKATHFAKENCYLIYKALTENRFLTNKDLCSLVIRNNKTFRTGTNTKITKSRLINETNYISSLVPMLIGVDVEKMTTKFKRLILRTEGIELKYRQSTKIFYVKQDKLSRMTIEAAISSLDLGFEEQDRLNNIYENWKEERY